MLSSNLFVGNEDYTNKQWNNIDNDDTEQELKYKLELTKLN